MAKTKVTFTIDEYLMKKVRNKASKECISLSAKVEQFLRKWVQ